MITMLFCWKLFGSYDKMFGINEFYDVLRVGNNNFGELTSSLDGEAL